MNFRDLTYNKLQRECKLRNLPAKGKTLELIARLEKYETNLVNIDIGKNNEDISTDLTIDDNTTNDFSTYTSSFDLLGLDTSDLLQSVTIPITNTKEVIASSVTVTQQEVTTKVVNNSTVVTTKEVVTNISKTNKNITYEQLESFYNKGFICLNNNSHITGIDARIMLSKLWTNYPQVQEYLSNYEDHTSLLKVQFGLTKEITEVKKVISKGRNLTPTKVEYGKEVNKTVYVPNDRGNDLGLPSDKRSPYKSGLKNGIIDHTTATSIYIDDKLIYSASGSVTKLQSQAYTKSGRSKDHKADCGYIGKSKNTKNKRSTGVKLTSSIQQGINTNLMGNLFKLAGHDHKMQVEIASNGTLYLNQYIRTEKIQTVIGTIDGKQDRDNHYQIGYADNFKLATNAVVDRHIQQLINKALHHDTSFMATSKVIEPDHTYQLDMRQAINSSKRSTRKDKYDNGRYRKAMFNTSF